MNERKRSKEISQSIDGESVSLAGWVHEIRKLGKLKFIVLRDREGLAQITLPKSAVKSEIFELADSVSRESVIEVKGKIHREARAPNGYEVIPDEIKIISPAASPLPLDPTEKVEANLDTRLDSRVMDLRKQEILALFKLRASILSAARSFLESQSFIEVHTPRIISTSSEGGAELFPVAYFEKEGFLAQSPQLYKQMLMGAGFEKVYEIATYFRAEEHDTIFHLNEITAIDCELSFIESESDVMDVIENLTLTMIKTAAQKNKELGPEREIKPPKTPYPRVKYAEAIELLEEAGLKIPHGQDLSTEAEKKLGEIMKERGYELYFITKYPLEIKPFYTMPDKENPIYSNSFDLDFKGREIISGSQRVHDYNLLVERIKKKGLAPENFKDYLNAFKYGMPPHGGFGLGIERFLMYLLDLPNIREAVLFPRDRNRLNP